MFTREELVVKLPSLLIQPKPAIEVMQFAPDDFPSSSSEEYIQLCRGIESDFENAVHFWVASQQCQDWNGREEYILPYLQEATCQPMDEEAFILILSQTQRLKPLPRIIVTYVAHPEYIQLDRQTQEFKRPIIVTPKGKYVWGQQMANEWNDSSALAEFEHEFIAFNWETTA